MYIAYNCMQYAKERIMAKTNVDIWLERETPPVRKALENASSYFDIKDPLTVNTLEAIYAQESSFGIRLGTKGIKDAAGHFQLSKDTAERYHLYVSGEDDQRFGIDYASIAAALYLHDLNRMFSKKTPLSAKMATIPVDNDGERRNFIFAAYNGGEGTVAKAQHFAQQAKKDPIAWEHVQAFLEQAEAYNPTQIRGYVKDIPMNEVWFIEKSPADKTVKYTKPRRSKGRCAAGEWASEDGLHVFICH